MKTVINEFEIVAPPADENANQVAAARPAAAKAADAVAATTPPLRPEDVEQVLRRLIQRRLRLWAD